MNNIERYDIKLQQMILGLNSVLTNPQKLVFQLIINSINDEFKDSENTNIAIINALENQSDKLLNIISKLWIVITIVANMKVMDYQIVNLGPIVVL